MIIKRAFFILKPLKRMMKIFSYLLPEIVLVNLQVHCFAKNKVAAKKFFEQYLQHYSFTKTLFHWRFRPGNVLEISGTVF